MGAVFQFKHTSYKVGEKTLINDVTFDVPQGSCFCIVGPSGSGKSTLLRLFNRLNEASSGFVIFDEKPLKSINPQTLRREVAMVFQRVTVFDGTVADNLKVFFSLVGETSVSDDDARIVSALRIAQLEESCLDQNAQLLSGGEQQRLGLARALLSQPKVLLLDEPTASLDVEVARKVFGQIQALLPETTVIMVNHNLSEVRSIATHVAMIDRGSIVEVADVKSFFHSPKSERVKAFLSVNQQSKAGGS